MSAWGTDTGWVVVAADATSRAQEAYEDLLGYTGKFASDPVDAGRGHKPPRSDIQKYKTAYEEYLAAKEGRQIHTPAQLEKVAPEKVEQAKRWLEKASLTGYEDTLVDLYKHYYERAHTLELGDSPAQFAFTEIVGMLTNNSKAVSEFNKTLEHKGYDPMTERLEPSQAKQMLGGALKKYEYSQYPKLYKAIEDTVADLYRRTSDENETSKLWPWAVSEIKREFSGVNGMWSSHNWPTIGERWPTPMRQHLVDIVDQTGGLLHRLRQEHRMPQGLDANNFKSLQEMENWLSEYRHASGEGDSGGKTTHEFDDGWKVVELNQPNQLEWEGEQMNHCVGGYWQSVRDGKSHIYSFRDHENKPHATLEFHPHSSSQLQRVGDATDEDWEAQRERDKQRGYSYPVHEERIFPEYKSLEHFKQARDAWEADPQETRNFGNVPWGRFKPVPLEPFQEPKGPLYQQVPGGMNNTLVHAVIPSDQSKTATLAQHMGPHDSVPGAQANTHIRKWLDHHRDKGWQIEREDPFFWPNGWDDFHQGRTPDGWRDDYGRTMGIHNYRSRDNTGAARLLDDWYDDHFRQEPEKWTGQVGGKDDELDKYGFPKGQEDEDETGVIVDWDDLNDDVMRVLSNEYDQSVNHTSDWEGLGKAYWHAWNLYRPWDGQNAEARERYKSALDNRIESWQDKLSEWGQNHVFDNGDYFDNEIREKYQELGGPVPKDEDGDELDHYDWNTEGVDEDQWREAQDEIVAEQEEAMYGDNWKFINYLYHLNDKHGPMTQRQLYEHHVNGTFPRYEDVRPPDPPASIPGALSHVKQADEMDWLYDQPDGQFYKWAFNPEHGALFWPVTGPDGDKADMQAGKAHIDMMNTTWERPGRYPYHPADRMGVAFHNRGTNQVFVSQYPRGAGSEVAAHAHPYLQEQIVKHHPSAEIVWPDRVAYEHRTAAEDWAPEPTYNTGMSMAFRYDPVSDELYWGEGHGVIDMRLYRMGLGPERIKETVEGRWRPNGIVEYYNHQPGVDSEALRERVRQEAAQRPWERPSDPRSPSRAAQVALPAIEGYAETYEAMRRAYAGEVIDLQQRRNERGCPVCGSATDTLPNGFLYCPHCPWKQGDPVHTCPYCGVKNTIQLRSQEGNDDQPYECVGCGNRFTHEDFARLDRPT